MRGTRPSGGGPVREGPSRSLGKDLAGARLIAENLAGVDLAGADLSGADLSRADLSAARLVGANLRGATLFGARLDRSMLLKADLTDANLSECCATGAHFGGARMHNARLFGATLDGATFAKASLTHADLRTASLNSARLMDADLGNADLTRASLVDSDLSRANVERAIFTDSDLRRSTPRHVKGFDTAIWIDANVVDVDFRGAYLLRRAIMDQNYLHEFKTRSRLHEWVYRVWWVTSDCGRSFVRWGLWTLLLAVLFAGLFNLVALDYGDHRAPLSSFYFSVVTLTTLGYGDVVPASTAAQVLAIGEVVLGYFMLGGLLSIFANKMARRAD